MFRRFFMQESSQIRKHTILLKKIFFFICIIPSFFEFLFRYLFFYFIFFLKALPPNRPSRTFIKNFPHILVQKFTEKVQSIFSAQVYFGTNAKEFEKNESFSIITLGEKGLIFNA